MADFQGRQAGSGGELNQIARLFIERECERLVLTYARLIDAGDLSGALDLFVEDAVVEGPRGGPPLMGREAIKAAYASGLAIPRKHLCTNILIDVETPERAQGSVNVVLFTGTPQAGHVLPKLDANYKVGVSTDTFQRTAAGWRFSHRKGSFTFE